MHMKFDPSLKIINAQPLPVFRIDSWGWRLANPAQPARDYRQLLRHDLARTSGSKQIVIMVHGAGFSPFSRHSNAQRSLFSRFMAPDKWLDRSWPRRFAGTNCQSEPSLSIGYGWNAIDSSVLSKTNHRALYDAAGAEAINFAKFVANVKELAPNRDIHVVACGLGARVVVQSLQYLNDPVLNRVILLGAHEFSTATLTALSSRAAKGARFYNLRSDSLKLVDQRANSEFPKSGPKDQVLALGFLFQRNNWVDIATATPTHRSQVMRGASFKRSHKAICRWSFGNDRSVDDLITRILHDAPKTDIGHIKSSLNKVKPPVEDDPSTFLQRQFALLSPLRRRFAG